MVFPIFLLGIGLLTAALLRFRKPPAIYWITATSIVLAVIWNHRLLKTCGGDCNIRVDLLLIAPVLLLAGVLCTIALLRDRQQRR